MKKFILRTTAIVFASLIYSLFLANIYPPAYALEYKTVKIIEKDTTGDGIKERIKILGDEKDGSYHAEVVHSNGNTYKLKADKNLFSLGHYTPVHSLKTLIADINGDKVPEITTLGSSTHEAPLHIFRWNGSDYKLIFSTWTYSSMNFRDITGDDVPELIVSRRLYGTGEEDIYYQWKDGSYKKIYYEMNAVRGFDKLRDILMMINNNAFPYSEDIPQRDELLKHYFTAEWVNNEDNIKYIQEWSKDLLSAQISEFLGIDQKMDPEIAGRVIEEKWKFKIKVFRIKGSRVIPINQVMEVDIKPVEELGEDRWRISSIRVRN